MFVAVETTPNPRTRRFLPGIHLSSAPREFSRDVPSGSPLVDALLSLPAVRTVLVNGDAVSVTMDDEAAWTDTVPTVREIVAEMLSPVSLPAGTEPEDAGDFDEADATVVATIKDLIETRIRPAVARDGGDIVFRSYRDGVLGLSMRGACSGCPSSAATLHYGIQNLLRHFVPEVTAVVAV